MIKNAWISEVQFLQNISFLPRFSDQLQISKMTMLFTQQKCLFIISMHDQNS